MNRGRGDLLDSAAMKKKLLRAFGCTAYLGFLLGIFAFASYLAFSQFVRRGVTRTPDLHALGVEEARGLLLDQGLQLSVSTGDRRFDQEVAKDHILMQRPRAGTLLKRGRSVTVVLSRGPQQTEVPEVVGLTLQAARLKLAQANLPVRATLNVYSSDRESGTVVAQEPVAGSMVEPEAEIDLFLALENVSETFVMPDLINLRYEDVRAFFEARGFRMGRVSYEPYHKSLAPGTVLQHYPSAGQPLRQGDVISLRVTPLPESDFDYVPAIENPDTPSGLSDNDRESNQPS